MGKDCFDDQHDHILTCLQTNERRIIMKARTMMMALAITLWLGAGFTAAQPATADHLKNGGEQIIRGERPPINYEKLDDEAWEKGVLLIKFIPEKTRHLEENPATLNREGFVTFAIEEVDRLAALYGVSDARQHFLSPALNNTFTERHKAWGFHLWYKLQLDERSSIIEAVREFAGLREVEIAEPVFKIELHEGQGSEAFEAWMPGDGTSGRGEWIPNDPQFPDQWNYHNTGQNGGTPGADISMLGAWAIEKGHPDVIVAVVDGGIEIDHEDLAANIWEGVGYNFVHDSEVIEPHDHGIHVAGTVAAVNNNNIGVAGVAGGSGGNDGISLMSCQVFASSGSGGFHIAPIWAADSGAAISQNSWGYTTAGFYNQDALDAIDYFNQYGGGEVMNGGITIFSAGNNNSSADWYPGFYSGTMAVASTDRNDVKSNFSNFGSWIDISAPGSSILSTTINNTYGIKSGTSMASPHVSGVAALILSYAHGAGSMLDNTDLWDLLVSTTDNIDHLNPSHAGLLGSGRLNAQHALEAAHAFASNVQRPVSFTATAVSENTIELAWQPNANNDAVLVAFSESGSFGIPVNGTTYDPGDHIAGGGTVLYAGQDQTGYLHTNLNYATTYYYRAWSYDGAEYSGNRASQATTFCLEYFPLPFLEDFNTTASIPPCWSTAGSANWAVGTFSNGLTGTTGNYAWVEISGNSARHAIMISPNFNFSNFSDVRLEFKHRYNHDRSSATLSYSLNGGSSWNAVQSWSSNTGTVTFNQVIAQLAGQPSVIFSWELDFGGGGPPHSSRSWSVDDVSVTGTSAGPAYTITATAGTGGSINPGGNITVAEGDNQSFSITPADGFEIDDVLVDGSSVGAVTAYTFSNVTADHTIHATFEEVPVITYTIEASAGEGGSISPSGSITVVEGDNQSFSITAGSGFEIADVVVDGNSVGAVTAYTFNNVTADHTIHAAFKTAPEDPCLITTLPYLQDFNAAAAIPECWESVINVGDVAWQVGTFSGGLNGTTGNYAYFFYQGNRERNADLISQPFDLSNYTGINLAFTHYHVASRSSVGLYYSTDGGNNWTTIQTWSSSTANPATFNQSLPALDGQPNVIFRWNMDYPGGGPPQNSRSWSVDDVVVTGTSDLKNGMILTSATEHNALSGKIEMLCYPNPANDLLNISFNHTIESGLLIVTDMQGRQIHNMEIKSLIKGNSLQLDISRVPNGPYLIKVLSEGGYVNQLIMKN